jgi:type III restriction enzyme
MEGDPGMTVRLLQDPILNSHYERPSLYWAFDNDGFVASQIGERRREIRLIAPSHKPRKRVGEDDERILKGESQGLSETDRQYRLTQQVTSIGALGAEWRQVPETQWKVIPETARLLKHRLHHGLHGIRRFFCQIEAAQTAIWLKDLTPGFRKHDNVRHEKRAIANDVIDPAPLGATHELGTGAGKSFVIGIFAAWQRKIPAWTQGMNGLTNGFSVATLKLTIRALVRVMQLNATDNQLKSLMLVAPNPVAVLGMEQMEISCFCVTACGNGRSWPTKHPNSWRLGEGKGLDGRNFHISSRSGCKGGGL